MKLTFWQVHQLDNILTKNQIDNKVCPVQLYAFIGVIFYELFYSYSINVELEKKTIMIAPIQSCLFVYCLVCLNELISYCPCNSLTCRHEQIWCFKFHKLSYACGWNFNFCIIFFLLFHGRIPMHFVVVSILNLHFVF